MYILIYIYIYNYLYITIPGLLSIYNHTRLPVVGATACAARVAQRHDGVLG